MRQTIFLPKASKRGLFEGYLNLSNRQISNIFQIVIATPDIHPCLLIKPLEVVIFPKNDGLPTKDYTINHGNDVTNIHDYLTNACS